MRQNNKLKTLVASAALAAAGSAMAGDYTPVINDKMPIEPPAAWSFCDIFDYGTLYEGEGFIREIALNGRYHGQYIDQSEEIVGGNNGFHQWQHRRARLGLDIKFANNIKFSSSLNYSDGSGTNGALTEGRFFNNFDELYLKWAPSKKQYVTVGKQKQKITREFSTSSKRIKTIERSHIVNEVADQKPWGVTVGFEGAGAAHEVGAWLTGHDGDWNTPRFDSRLSLSYRYEKGITDATDFHFDYVFTNNSGGTVNGRGSAPGGNDSPYEHVLAIGTDSDFGRFDLVTDLIVGLNRESSGAIAAGDDTWGFVIMPTYEITEKLEFVAKYAYMDQGRNQRTQRFPSRQRVENYHTFYAGFNYYLCGDNLKLMAGYEYATGSELGTGNDISSDSLLFGVRAYF